MSRDFKVNNFDLLRLFAACEVLLLHSYLHLNIPFPGFFKVMSNFPGVPMFFTMSGFLISASLERNGNLLNYFRNRAFRIYPALIVCVILTIPTIAFFGHINFVNPQTIPWFISQCVGLIYTPGFLRNYGIGSYNGSLWTIPVELQFYFALPIIYAITSSIVTSERAKTIVIAIICLIFCAIALYVKLYYSHPLESETQFEKILRYTFVPNIYLFLLGVLLQRLKVHQSDFIFGKGLIWLGAYLVVCYLLPASTTLYFFQLLMLGVTTISLSYTFPTIAHKVLKGNDISYGVYIYHGLVLGVVAEFKLFGNPQYVSLIAVITLILATLSWKFIERPIMKMKNTSMHKVTKASIA